MLLVLATLLAPLADPAAARGLQPKPETPLVTIDGTVYTVADFRPWWREWREAETPLPTTLDPFVEWHLQAHEAQRMELYREATFQRRVEVFRRVRSLMRLKAEEVDQRIELTDDRLYQLYLEQHTPVLQVRNFFFHTEEQATAAAAELQEGHRTADELATLPTDAGGPDHSGERRLHLPRKPADWQQALAGAVPGDVVGPLPGTHGAIVLQIIAAVESTSADLEPHRAGLERDLRRREEQRLTSELVARLRAKFAVEINHELLARLSPEPPGEELADLVLIDNNQEPITVAQFWAVLGREQEFRRRHQFAAEEFERLKQRVVNGIIAQTLISWEADARDYHRREPLAPIYQFYRQHRLIQELDARLIQPRTVVEEAEIEDYYQRHPELFTRPEELSFMLFTGPAELVDDLRREIVGGRDFTAAISRHSPGGAPRQRLAVTELDPAVAAVAAELAPGEVSRLFPLHNHYALLRLSGRHPGRLQPLAAVREEIRQTLQEQKEQEVRAELINRLRQHAAIEINQPAWQRLRRELESHEKNSN